MGDYIVTFAKTFTNEFDRLSKIDQQLVLDKISFLKRSPSHPSLHTKKLRGKRDRFESRMNMDLRIIWRYKDKKSKIIQLVDVGHHDILKKY